MMAYLPPSAHWPRWFVAFAMLLASVARADVPQLIVYISPEGGDPASSYCMPLVRVPPGETVQLFHGAMLTNGNDQGEERFLLNCVYRRWGGSPDYFGNYWFDDVVSSVSTTGRTHEPEGRKR